MVKEVGINNTKRKKKLLPKKTWKVNWNILMIIDVFLNQQRVNVLKKDIKKYIVAIETFQLSFHVYVCAFCSEISSFFR